MLSIEIERHKVPLEFLNIERSEMLESLNAEGI
jgi:hypothetical protein